MLHTIQMKNISFVLPIIVLIVGMSACDQLQNNILNGNSPGTGDDDGVSISPDDIPPDDTTLVGDVVIVGDGVSPPQEWINDKYQLNSAAITDDTLEISVSYGGGCEVHEFTLIADNTFMESDPVQLAVSIVHNANLDYCERWVTESYHFDLTPIKTMYQQSYQQDAGTVVLNLENIPDGAPALVYKFS